MLRALIVDDDPDVRILLRTLLESACQGLAVVAEAASGTDGIELWREHQPGVVVLDESMPGLSGIEVARRILAERPDQAIVLFSAYLSMETRQAAAELGVRACVNKGDIKHLVATVRACSCEATPD